MIDNLYYSDNELLKLIKEGSDEAFRQLFYKFYPRLLRYAVRYVNDEDIAEDILQDCFISFWEKSRALKNISISSLLFCMVRNACLNYIKHNSLIENVSVDYVFDIGGEEKSIHWICNSRRMRYFSKKSLRYKYQKLYHYCQTGPSKCLS